MGFPHHNDGRETGAVTRFPVHGVSEEKEQRICFMSPSSASVATQRSAVIVALGVLLCGCGANFGVVEDGQLYRSAQLGKNGLEDAIENWGIRTVVNLRGSPEGERWYENEKKVTESLGVEQVDIEFSARRLPDRDDLLLLLDTFHRAERPILVHCQAGADRTSLASVVWSMDLMGLPKEQALEQCSIRFGHLEWLYPAIDYFLELYEGEEWAREHYDPCVQEYEYYDKSKYCR